MTVLASTRDAQTVVRFGETCRRMHSLASDDVLWRSLYVASAAHGGRGPPPHHHFAAFGKDWRWLYRAALPLSPRTTKRARSVGSFYCDDRGSYEGEFRRGLRHGYGHISAVALLGTYTYEGMWKGGEMHGYGIHTWSNGACYRGNWMCDKRHGRGAVTYSDGHLYEGTWVHDEFEGTGVHTLPDGTKLPCERVRGVWHDTDPNDARSPLRNDVCSDRQGDHVVTTAVARLFAPGRYARGLGEGNVEYADYHENQRRIHGFDETELRYLCSTLAQFAIDLVDALARDGEQPPHDLARRIHEMKDGLGIVACGNAFLEIHHQAHAGPALDDLCAIIGRWSAFGGAFSRFAAPRVRALDREHIGPPIGFGSKGWSRQLADIAQSIEGVARGERPTAELGFFRQLFFRLAEVHCVTW